MVVSELRSSYEFALLSNDSALLGGVTPHFVSHDLGLATLESAIYPHVTTELGVAPADWVAIDDRAPNIDGARSAGLEASLFIGSAQLMRNLISYGVDANG